MHGSGIIMNKTCSSSTAKRGRNKRRKTSHILVKYSGPSYSDLPRNIVEIILLKSSIKRICVCKSVCKTWYDLISDPEFAKLHLDQAQVYPLIRNSHLRAVSRTLYLLQPEQDDFELKLDRHHTSRDSRLGSVCKVKVKLDTKFRLPLRNHEMINNDKNDGEFNSKCESGRNNDLKPNIKDHKYSIINSCNGLLCLSDPSTNEPNIVFNPVTGEFINLPVERTFGQIYRTVGCGFGFSPMTNQYKVLRIFVDFTHDDIIHINIHDCLKAEIHILGTKSWKCLGLFPYFPHKKVNPTYLNGYLYWYNNFKTLSVMFFDIEKDCFGSFNLPYLQVKVFRNCELGVLGGELCLSIYVYDDRVDIWVMKDCDGEKDWFKMHSINTEIWGSHHPIKYLNNGVLLMYNYYSQAFVYHNPNKLGFRFMKISGMQTRFKVIYHIPSFISLKDALSGQNTTVFNVRSRCRGELKLHEEEGGEISIVEAAANDLNDFDQDHILRLLYE